MGYGSTLFNVQSPTAFAPLSRAASVGVHAAPAEV
jgi:hypothetical protein